LTGTDQASSALERVDTQMSGPPNPPARVDEKTSSRPSLRTFGWMSFAAGSFSSVIGLAVPKPLGRFHLVRDESEDAVHLLDEAIEEAEARGMVAFVPWPEAFRGELDLVLGDLASAEARFEHAFALGCQVGDPCWESIALRGLGLVAAARGDVARALELLVDAPKLCRRLPDTYLWIEAYGLDALCAVAVEHGAAPGPWIDELEATTARRGIRELLLRATVYRARLGESGALDVACSLAAQIDNPALEKLLESAHVSAVER
jgi:hypothetical protein